MEAGAESELDAKIRRNKAKLYRIRERRFEIENRLTKDGASLIPLLGYGVGGRPEKTPSELMTKILKHLDDSKLEKKRRRVKRIKKAIFDEEREIEDLKQWLDDEDDDDDDDDDKDDEKKKRRKVSDEGDKGQE